MRIVRFLGIRSYRTKRLRLKSRRHGLTYEEAPLNCREANNELAEAIRDMREEMYEPTWNTGISTRHMKAWALDYGDESGEDATFENAVGFLEDGS
jgi:hypothetical protein